MGLWERLKNWKNRKKKGGDQDIDQQNLVTLDVQFRVCSDRYCPVPEGAHGHIILHFERLDQYYRLQRTFQSKFMGRTFLEEVQRQFHPPSSVSCVRLRHHTQRLNGQIAISGLPPDITAHDQELLDMMHHTIMEAPGEAPLETTVLIFDNFEEGQLFPLPPLTRQAAA